MDPYVYPGTRVLRNLRDIRDFGDLAEFEADVTSLRLKELESQPLGGAFDAKHLREIHRYIFQDVYAWAGEFRTVNIAKPGEFYFALAPPIEPSLGTLFGQLQQENLLHGLNAQAFAERAGHYLGEINAIHPFRDGNGRTQREFVRELASGNSFVLNWSGISAEQMRDASRISFQRGDSSGLAGLIHEAIRELD